MTDTVLPFPAQPPESASRRTHGRMGPVTDVPRLGPEDTEPRAICGYSLKPGEPRCPNPAEVHLCIEVDTDDDQHLIATCLEHFQIAKAVGIVVDRHKHQGVCGLPGTLWSFDLLRCVIDDSGQEPVLAACAELELAGALT